MTFYPTSATLDGYYADDETRRKQRDEIVKKVRGGEREIERERNTKDIALID